MISNLPSNVAIEKFQCFDFGSAEASEDELLEECPCVIKPIREFLSGKKDIVIGERGSGKSALFRLLAKEAIFLTTNKTKNK